MVTPLPASNCDKVCELELCVTVICPNKTGERTKSKMVKYIFFIIHLVLVPPYSGNIKNTCATWPARGNVFFMSISFKSSFTFILRDQHQKCLSYTSNFYAHRFSANSSKTKKENWNLLWQKSFRRWCAFLPAEYLYSNIYKSAIKKVEKFYFTNNTIPLRSICTPSLA